ncbi:MAG: DEAD/DEAH box helicase family protein, partial [Nanoarchaeota archaeon]
MQQDGNDAAQPLPPLVFSNGKTQEDVVKEISTAIENGHRLIFLKGMCGTGKSAIALHLAKELGRTSIVVPIKSLQEQYTNDYTRAMYVMNKENSKKLKIASIVGRQNFSCTYLKE